MIRWHVFAAAFGLALALACGGAEGGGADGAGGEGGGGPRIEKTPCSSDDDCRWNEICEAAACARLCDRHGACGLGEHCLESSRGARACGVVEPANDCTADAGCGAGRICVEGACIPDDGPEEGCFTVAECYPAGAYCAAFGDDTACLDVTCGSEWNACERCALGPGGGAAEMGGPLLFAPAQVSACSRNALCPEIAPWACRFAFAAFSPDGSLPTGDLNTMVRFVGPGGAAIDTFGTTSYAQDGYPMYAFLACFPADDDGRVEGAVYLVDQHTRVSQTLCVGGRTTGPQAP